MLGRVVSFVTNPLADFIPQSDPQHIDFNPRDILPDLFYEAVQSDDVAHLLEEMGDVTITKMLKQRLQIYASNTESRNFKIKAGVVTRYDMIHAERNLAVLVKDAGYATQILEMFERRKAKSLAMVTGMLTCRDLTVGWTYSKIFHEMEAEIKEEVVFALAYDEVKLKQVKKSSKDASWYPTTNGNGLSSFQEKRETVSIRISLWELISWDLDSTCTAERMDLCTILLNHSRPGTAVVSEPSDPIIYHEMQIFLITNGPQPS